MTGRGAVEGAFGDFRYPDDPVFGDNAADIVEVRAAADLDAWYVLIVLNFLEDPARSAFDVWLDRAAVSMRIRGLEGDIDGQAVDVHADPEANFFEIRVPRTSFDPGDEVHELFVASGILVDGDWYRPDTLLGGTPYFDLAYVPDETMDSYWNERRQAAHIASGDFLNDFFPVDFGRLLSDPCTRRPCVNITPLEDLHTRVFRSSTVEREGVFPQHRWGQQDRGYRIYGSRYQTYALYTPLTDPASPRPLALMLHPEGGNHMSYPLAAWPGIRRWADELEAVVAMPLSRGEGGWYEAEAELDVFEVWRDVAAHHNIDPDRVYLMGVGMGGFGALRLGHLYPDQFAAVLSWGAPVTPNATWLAPAAVTWPQPNPPACDADEEGCGYNLISLFGNAANVHHLLVYGALDPLLPTNGPEEWMDRFADASSPHTYKLYPARGHEASLVGDGFTDVLNAVGDAPARQRSPTRVGYRIIRDLFDPDHGLKYDSSFWLSELTLADGVATGSIEASRSIIDETSERFGPSIGLDPVSGPFREQGLIRIESEALANFVDLRIGGLEHARLDAVRMTWDVTAPIRIRGESDRAVTLVIAGPFPVTVEVEGAASTRLGQDVVLHISSGSFEVTITAEQ